MVLLSEDVKKICLAEGAAVAGIASADSFVSAYPGYAPTDKLNGCRSVVVVGIPFPKESFDMDRPDYTAVYNRMVSEVNDLAKRVETHLKKTGAETQMIGGFDGEWIDGYFRADISLKHAAELAGLGHITMNNLLLHPVYGNLLWFAAVLTTDEFSPDTRTEEDFCSKCGMCVSHCPSGALSDSGGFSQSECYKGCCKIVEGKLELQCFDCRRSCPLRFGVQE